MPDTRLTPITLALALLLVAGCASARHARRGDEALEAGRHEQAYRHFQNALAARPELRNDPDFHARFQFARSRATFEQGQQFVRQQAYEQAVARFEESLDADPDFSPAQQALHTVRMSAASQLHDRAITQADQGRRDPALELLQRALQYQPDHLRARRALDSLLHPSQFHTPAAYAQALRLRDERLWQRALDQLDIALRAEPDHLPSRLARFEAADALRRAGDLHTRAADHLRAKRLPEAIDLASQAVNLSPAFEQAQALLTTASAARQEALDHFHRARELAARHQWDDALSAVGASLDLYPFDAQAAAFRDQTTRDAAAAFTAQAQADLSAGRLTDAETAFREALRFLPAHQPARDGLARTSLERGRSAHKQNLPGNALLWYLDAHDAAVLPEIKQAIASAKDDLHRASAVALRLEVVDAVGNSGDAVHRLSAHLGQAAPRSVPPFIAIRGDAQVHYIAAISLTALSIQQNRTRIEQRSHHYIEEVQQPNPAIPRLRSDLRRAESELAHLERQFHEHCHACRGAGRDRCPHCHGRGQIACNACAGRGHMFIGAERKLCDRCGGRGQSTCTRCSGGHIQCGHCRGTGRRYPHITQHDVNRARDRVFDLRRRLSREPDLILVQYARDWPYTLEHYRKTGRLALTVAPRDDAGNAVSDPETIPADFVIHDQRVINANPAVGLPPDELELPDDALVLDDLARQAAERAAPAAIRQVVTHLVAERLERARNLAADGRDAQAVEANVTAALFMESIDAQQAANLWATLRER